MNIIYISATSSGMHSHGIYYDLFKELSDIGHDVTIVYARGPKDGAQTELYSQDGMTYLGIKSPNVTKNKNLYEKGLGILTIDYFFSRAIRQHLSNKKYDLVMYSTPPITFTKTLKYFKKQGSFLYLMLKDIFPQNGVDLDMFSQNGLVYKYFRSREKHLYKNADLIGVMSQANMDYVLEHNPKLKLKEKLLILPNALKVRDFNEMQSDRSKYGLNESDFVLVYGGNLGLPQDIEYVKECILALENTSGVKLVICGDGSERESLEAFLLDNNITNTRYGGVLPSNDYRELMNMADCGLIFLDHRFTIPNYPQRVLSYLEAKLPIICSTDVATDVGSDAEDNNYGISLESNDVEKWIEAVNRLKDDKETRELMGLNGFKHFEKQFNVEKVVQDVILNVEDHIEKSKR